MTPIDADSGSETQRTINDPGRGFLGHLTPPVFKHYPYRGRAQFEDDFKHACDTTDSTIEWFLVTAVDNKTFATEFREAEETPFSRWCTYDPTLELILINVVKSSPHETASGVFGDMLHESLIPAGMQRSLVPIGSTTHFATLGAKEPDKAWHPSRLPGRSDKWPSAVLEVAYSETRAKLQSDVRYWLRAPEGEVKTILTLQITCNEPKVIIEKWESNDGHGHQEQQIVISKTGEIITITGGPLVLDFRRLFLRAPTIPRERNIEIDNEKLEFLATEVWAEQGF